MAVVPLLICDDSNMARKQLLRALPEGLELSVTQAENGQQGLDAIRQGLGKVVLLDLTMPEMDGYEVLAAIRKEGLKAQVIVVSGDVQDEAVRRVLALGAVAFLKKPANADELRAALARCGLNSQGGMGQFGADMSVNFNDAFRETVNVAMGRAAALLAKVLNVFIELPIPNVNVLEVGELHMALADAQLGNQLTAICQGYIGEGIAGEALLMFHDSNLADMARLMRQDYQESTASEMVLDLSALLIGACLIGIGEQIDVAFSFSHPQLLGEHARIEDLISLNRHRWRQTLAVEISYSVEGHAVHFDLLLLFTETSLPRLKGKLEYMMN